MPPEDDHNARLVAHVRPPGWVNPTPAGRYHLVVIGAGTAGLVTAIGAAGLGAKVALVERRLMGGDCLNVGCVPSKALLAAARTAAAVRGAGGYGVHIPGEVTVDFSAVMQRMRRLRADLARHDSARRFQDGGVDVFLGAARFLRDGELEVGGETLPFQKAVIATGARPLLPPVPGLEEAGCLTNETLFNLAELPRRLAVIGGGPIGCEMAQAFSRFGSRVTLIEQGGRILPRDDPDAAEVVRSALERDGVRFRLGTRPTRVEFTDGERRLHWGGDAAPGTLAADAVLVAAGRSPNVEGLGLERVGVEYDHRRGVHVDDRLRTTNRRIYAAGDVCSRWKFTHAADQMARVVIRNSLFWGRRKLTTTAMPWCTYTSPELAHVGLSPEEADERGVSIDTYTHSFGAVDRAVLDGSVGGFVRVHTRKGQDRILGATIVGEHAGELISEVTLAMQHGIGLARLPDVVHPYPTRAEAIRKVGDRYNRTRLTPLRQRLLGRLFAWRR